MRRLSQTCKRLDFGLAMPADLVAEIDRTRGDVPRSVWLRRAAIAELERIKSAELLSGAQVSSHGRQRPATNDRPTPGDNLGDDLSDG